MQVDDEFFMAVSDRLPQSHSLSEAIAATLAVAAERGMLVPEGAVKMWGLKTGETIYEAYADRVDAFGCRYPGDSVVRVAVVEIKE